MNSSKTPMEVRRFVAGLVAAAGFALIGCGLGLGYAFAQSEDAEVAADINDLKREIENKKANIDHINRRIDEYKVRIEQQHRQSATLDGEIDLLENRLAKTELDIEAAEEEIDTVAAEITLLDRQVGELDAQLTRERIMLEDIVRKIQSTDDRLDIELLFGTENFGELFDRLHYLENVNTDLAGTLDRAKAARDGVVGMRAQQEAKRGRLTTLHAELERKKALGEEEQVAKETLLAESQHSEAQFSALLYALRQEQAYIDQQVAALQGEIEAKLNDMDGIGDSSVMSWPVASKRVTATFHDPTYPYRHLFEHSGLDIGVPSGTQLTAATAGYVAWVRTGKLYGNYIMIIHTNGLATLYAHLSSISVTADQFVTRGQPIGKTGNTGLSTGPHLHFEVRKNGIPVNPLNYLLE